MWKDLRRVITRASELFETPITKRSHIRYTLFKVLENRSRNRGARPAGVLTSSRKFIPVQEMIPEFVVPNLEGFKLKAYVSYKTPPGTEQPMTAESLFNQTVAPHIQRDFEANEFDPQQLEKYGLEKTQEGKLFKLYPKNFIR
ncbi:hypothetical protein Q7C36_010328 [Tachysurus vachellii]|uniref:39S ribosomal protein L41, mitochondrial n=1 Tax=Tachysurus vachellii TaxID=175792 RepID=A0AA88MXG0_TACVA|nr:hypothetical protein Q7C36_010328 [Tachysurus vachellii]